MIDRPPRKLKSENFSSLIEEILMLSSWTGQAHDHLNINLLHYRCCYWSQQTFSMLTSLIYFSKEKISKWMKNTVPEVTTKDVKAFFGFACFLLFKSYNPYINIFIWLSKPIFCEYSYQDLSDGKKEKRSPQILVAKGNYLTM